MAENRREMEKNMRQQQLLQQQQEIHDVYQNINVKSRRSQEVSSLFTFLAVYNLKRPHNQRAKKIVCENKLVLPANCEILEATDKRADCPHLIHS